MRRVRPPQTPAPTERKPTASFQLRSAGLRRRWDRGNYGSKFLFLLGELPGEVEHDPAPVRCERFARLSSERRGGGLLDRLGHLEEGEALAAPFHQGAGDATRSHSVD